MRKEKWLHIYISVYCEEEKTNDNVTSSEREGERPIQGLHKWGKQPFRDN